MRSGSVDVSTDIGLDRPSTVSADAPRPDNAPVDLETFERSLTASEPPAGLADLVRALWYERRGRIAMPPDEPALAGRSASADRGWTRAHEIAQDIDTADAAWVHAYLHRREGDQSNAAYWYRRAGKPVQRGSLDDEWRAIVEALLARGLTPASRTGFRPPHP